MTEMAAPALIVQDLSFTYRTRNTPAIQNVNFGLERRVHPGWITQCVETGERFASQNRAAEVFGGTASRMSEHLRGARENFNGYHFIRVQEFVTA